MMTLPVGLLLKAASMLFMNVQYCINVTDNRRNLYEQPVTVQSRTIQFTFLGKT